MDVGQLTRLTKREEPRLCDRTSVTTDMTPAHTRRWSSDHPQPHGKGQRSGRSSKRPKGGLGTSRGHPVPPPRGFGPLEFGPVCGGHRGRRRRRVGAADNTRHPPYLSILEHSGEGVTGTAVCFPCFSSHISERFNCDLRLRRPLVSLMQGAHGG